MRRIKDWRIKQLLITKNVIVFSVLLCISAVFIINTNDLRENSRWEAHVYNVIVEANQLQTLLVDQETGMRGFVITGDEEFLEPYNAGTWHFDLLMDSIKNSNQFNPKQQAQLKAIDSLALLWRSAVAEPQIRQRRGFKRGEELEAEISDFMDAGVGQTAKENVLGLLAKTAIPSAKQQDIRANMGRVEKALNAYLFNEKESFLAACEDEKQALTARLDFLSEESAVRQAVLFWLNGYVEKLIAMQKEEAATGSLAAYYAMFQKKRGKYLMDEIRAGFVVFNSSLRELLAEKEQQTKQAVFRNKLFVVCSTLFVILVAVFMLFMALRTISRALETCLNVANAIAAGDLSVEVPVGAKNEVGQLQSAIKDMSTKLSEVVGAVTHSASGMLSASKQVHAASQSISLGANQQAVSVEGVSATVAQIGVNIQQNTQDAQTAKRSSDAAYQGVEELRQSAQEAIEASHAIAQKINVINEIASQTNILAINAAIEAARSGREGKGFGVVAKEVRKLAEYSSQTAKEIEQLTSSNLQQAQTTGKKMEELIPVIQSNAKLVEQISLASLEQSKGTDLVREAMQQLNHVSQQNAASSEELATSAEEMNSQAAHLKDIVGFFASIESKANRDSVSEAEKADSWFSSITDEAPEWLKPKFGAG